MVRTTTRRWLRQLLLLLLLLLGLWVQPTVSYLRVTSGSGIGSGGRGIGSGGSSRGSGCHGHGHAACWAPFGRMARRTLSWGSSLPSHTLGPDHAEMESFTPCPAKTTRRGGGGSRQPPQRRRKRDLLSQWVGRGERTFVFGRPPLPLHRQWSRTVLEATNHHDSDNDDNDTNPDPIGKDDAVQNNRHHHHHKKDTSSLSSSSSLDPVKDKLEEIRDKVEAARVHVQEKYVKVWFQAIPQPIQDVVSLILQKLRDWKLLFIGFTTGAVLAVAAIVVPIYSSVESLSQPVTLFETILGDLEMAYVDPVDTTKLFETGVSAMLRSLDPYTEFESKQAAADLTESIDGKYAGVGLIISGTPQPRMNQQRSSSRSESASSLPLPLNHGEGAGASKLLPKDAQEENLRLRQENHDMDDDTTGSNNADISSSGSNSKKVKDKNAMVEQEDHYRQGDGDEDDDFDDDLAQTRRERAQELDRARRQGIRVVSAFEGYAFDYGMRVGDKIVAIDNEPIRPSTSVDQVRNALRGEPGTLVSISFERDGVPGVQTVTMPRTVVRMRDVKLATLLGRPQDGIGYIQLTGFASDAGREMRNAIQYLQQAAEDATDGERSLQGLILDLRNNPGGLLTSAVDVASQLVPKGSDIVSAKGRGFPGILYRSRADPILDPSTRLAVLVNGGTASAAEIVSGAVQDLDVGIIVGADRTFGKGLVQNVEDLPFNTALKFTVAKYYTPSGRCIQGVKYTEGGGLKEEDGRYTASRVSDKDRSVFYTKSGRIVRDGGGIEADYKVSAPKASALEITLLRSGVFSEFASEWSKKNELTNNFQVDEDTYKSFQAFVNHKQKSGELNLEELYKQPLNELKKALKQSGYKGSEKGVEQLQANIVREIQKDFERYRSDIKEDISQSILARYLPESMLIERGVKSDKQVEAAVKLLTTNSGKSKFDRILARQEPSQDSSSGLPSSSAMTASSTPSDEEEGEDTNRIRASLSW